MGRPHLRERRLSAGPRERSRREAEGEGAHRCCIWLSDLVAQTLKADVAYYGSVIYKWPSHAVPPTMMARPGKLPPQLPVGKVGAE